jgi:hypothetical protein
MEVRGLFQKAFIQDGNSSFVDSLTNVVSSMCRILEQPGLSKVFFVLVKLDFTRLIMYFRRIIKSILLR